MHVDLAGNNKLMTQRRLEDHDIEVLCSILSKSTILASIDLRYNNFTDVGAAAVAQLLEVVFKLQNIVHHVFFMYVELSLI